MIKFDFFTILLISVSILGLISIFAVIKGLKESKEEKEKIAKITSGLLNNSKKNSRKSNVIKLRMKLFMFFITLVSAVIIIILIPLNGSDHVVFYFVLAAFLFGFTASWVFSSLFVNPIKILLRYAEKILENKDKENLSDMAVILKSNDEISVLAGIIGEMKDSLEEAALTTSELTIARELQKKFLPLEMDSMGRKFNFGKKESVHIEFFAYYAGAKGMSGDYFDFKELDERYYAFIKCDIAGKGIPAAIIMVQVATLFKNHFSNWTIKNKGLHLENLVYLINDYIESLNFEDRFAALTLGILDSHNGEVYLCSAGDKIIHIFDASLLKFMNINLGETPAAGIMPTNIVKYSDVYKVQRIKLKKNDILFLYTDGIEESKRKFRNNKFQPIVSKDTKLIDEDMGHERVENIINAVMSKDVYSLKKNHNPEGENKLLDFNFINSRSSVEDAVMGLVSIEKMFRSYKNPNAPLTAYVQTDKLIDQYLKKYFLQYGEYCSQTRDSTVNNLYIDYNNLEEDEQYDDLTVMGIRIK